MNTISKKVLGGFVIVTGGFIALVIATMFLWNWLMPEIFNLPTISFWQSLGLVILSNLLFPGKGTAVLSKSTKLNTEK